MEELKYIVTLNNGKDNSYAIFKDVTKKLKEEPNITILELLNYILQQPINDEYEKNTSINIRKLIQRIRTKRDLFLLIRTLTENNDYRIFTNSGRNTEAVNPKDSASNYFESRFFSSTEYKALDLKLNIARWREDKNYT